MDAAPSPRLPFQQNLPRRPNPVRLATAKLGQVVPFVAPPLGRTAGRLERPRGRSQSRPARVWLQDARRVGVLGSEAAAAENLDPGIFQGGSNLPLGLVRGEDVIRGVTPPEAEAVLGEGA